MVHLGAASASERLSAVTICNGEYIHEGLLRLLEVATMARM